MKEQIPVDKLARGMFVAELDRPWLETPFLIQGFVIDSNEQIGEIQRCCKFVYVERSLSLGDQFRPDPADKTIPPRPSGSGGSKARAEQDRPPDVPKPGLLNSLKRIFLAAFSSTPPATEAPQSHSSSREPTVTIYADGKDAPKPKARPIEIRPGAGISNEERAYLERATDPDASVRIYTEKELAARNGFFQRLARWLGLGAKDSVGAPSGVGAPGANAPVYADKTLIEEELPMAREAHQKVEVVVQEVIADLQNNKALDLEKVSDAVGWMVESVVRNPDGMIWLARLKSADSYTYDHGLNTAIYLIAFGRHLGLPEDQLQAIGTVGLMQDIGKLKLPRALLDKRERLTAPELKIFQGHVAQSVEILRGSKDATETLLEAVHQHHERYDGSGYPRALKGDEISTLGGMAGLVDTYAAMISARPYAQAKSVQQALHDLYAARNKMFKSELVEEFIQCVGVFPVGSLVELNTAEVAVVVSQNRSRRLKPRVMLVLDANRQPFAQPVMYDLIVDPPTPSGEPYRIVRGLQAGMYEYDPQQTLDVLMESK
jgi:HD-GYP domain-containing protein (c-di-GMP phosphodiesterase class II)